MPHATLRFCGGFATLPQNSTPHAAQVNAALSIYGESVPNINYEERAIAFIDVLGFSALVNSSVTSDKKFLELQGIVSILESVIPRLDSGVNKNVPAELIPKYLQVSDCIILSAPLTTKLEGWPNYDGLEIVMMRVSQLTHLFLEAGYLLQGGIDVGLTWHGEANIVGPAYQAAATLEKDGINPCILLTESANNHRAVHYAHTSRLSIEFDGSSMVNGLHGAYIQNRDLAEEDVYSNYRAIVAENISLLSGRPQKKWLWFQSYLENEISTAYPWLKKNA